MTYRPALFCCLILFILNSQNIFAQTDSTKNQGFVTYNTEVTQKKPPVQFNRNAIKIGISAILWGRYGIAYEKELGEFFSIEAGIGVTGRNYFGNAIDDWYKTEMGDDQRSDNFSMSDDIRDDDYSYDGRETKLGWYATLMPRMYFSRFGFERMYMGLNLQYKIYNFTAYQPTWTTTSETEMQFSPSRPTIEEYEQNIMFGLAFGSQYLNKQFLMDWYASFGINMASGERRDLGYSPYDQIFGSRVMAGPEPRDFNEGRIFIEVGFQMGINW